jgi:hypothetical protein
VRAVLTATYTNDAPDGLPDYVAANDEGLPRGTNRLLLSVWTPYRSAGATVDGEAVGLEHHLELGRHRYLRILELAPGESVTFTLRLEGALADDDYRLTMVRQPRADPSEVEIEVHDPDGKPVRTGGLRILGGWLGQP